MPDISFNCPECDQNLEAPEDFAGQTVECPGCGKDILVPETAPAHADDDDTDEDDDDGAEEAGEEGVCPECGEEMEPDSVLCLSCGYHTGLRRRIKTDLAGDDADDET